MSARLLDQIHRLRNGSFTAHSGGAATIDPESSRVKRALFGPVDHEENHRFVQRELERNRKMASERWNYDFGKDEPLPGRYQWEITKLSLYPKLKTKTTSPQPADNNSENSDPSVVVKDRISESSRLGESSNSFKSSSSSPGDKSSSSSSSERVCDNKSSSQRSRATRAASRGQANKITDYLQHRKRSKSKVKTQERKIAENKLDENNKSLADENSSSSSIKDAQNEKSAA